MSDLAQALPEPLPASPHPQPLPIEGRGVCSDPEIEALLQFEPVPRKRAVDGAWTPELQREFIRRLAITGSPGRASEEMGKTDTGVRKMYRSPEAASFRAAWHAAVALAKGRKAGALVADEAVAAGSRPPSLDNRRKPQRSDLDWEGNAPLPGQVLNEKGLWEDEENYRRRGEEAKDSICGKLTNARRLFLEEISGCPGKRAAFEMLTELPVDWHLAARGLPQPDEPWRKPRARQPDQILTAESGWSWGEIGYGPDKKAELRTAIDKHREEAGLPPVEWEA